MSARKRDIEYQAPEDAVADSRYRTCVKNNLFLLVTFGGIVAGFIIGLGVRPAQPDSDVKLWIGMPGELYLRTLLAMVLPLIACSVIESAAKSDAKSNGRICLMALVYIIAANSLGGIIGIILALIAKPGAQLHPGSDGTVDTKGLRTIDIFADFIRNLFPDNVIGAALQQSQTKYLERQVISMANVSGVMTNVTKTELKRTLSVVHGMNIIGVVVCCGAVGLAAAQLGEKSKPLVSVFQAGYAVIFQIFEWIKWSTPVGVASLIAKSLVEIDDLQSAFASMGIFVLVVCGGNLLYQLIILPLIYLIFTRKNPILFLKSVIKPWLITFGPSSTAVALPEVMRVSREVYKVNHLVEGIVPAMCTTLNKNGSCMFIAATSVFIASYAGEDLNAGLIFAISTLSILSSFAIPSIPSASIVTILIILKSLGIPPVNIGLVLAVEWITDRIRATTNVVSTMNATAITWNLYKRKARPQTPEHTAEAA